MYLNPYTRSHKCGAAAIPGPCLEGIPVASSLRGSSAAVATLLKPGTERPTSEQVDGPEVVYA